MTLWEVGIYGVDFCLVNGFFFGERINENWIWNTGRPQKIWWSLVMTKAILALLSYIISWELILTLCSVLDFFFLSFNFFSPLLRLVFPKLDWLLISLHISVVLNEVWFVHKKIKTVEFFIQILTHSTHKIPFNPGHSFIIIKPFCEHYLNSEP